MTRSAAIVLAFLLALPALADTEDSVGGKTASQWMQILHSAKQVRARQAALTALEVLGPKVKGVVPALVDALEKDSDPEIRQGAAQVLGRMGGEARQAVEPLGQALRKDKSVKVREAAALALGGRMVPHSKIAVLVLADALQDPESGPRQAAAKALKDLGEDAQPALPRLIEVARDPKMDRFTRTYAIQLVARLGAGGDAAVQVLAGVFAEKDAPPSVRVAAAEALGRYGPASEPAVPVLAVGLKKAPVEVRRAAAAALAKIGPGAFAAWTEVKSALGDEDTAVRSGAVRVAGTIGREQPEVVPALAKIAGDDKIVEVRLAAIQELGQLGKAAGGAVPVLTRLAANDTRASIREAADAALQKIKASPTSGK